MKLEKRLGVVVMGVLVIEGAALIGVSALSSGNKVYGQLEERTESERLDSERTEDKADDGRESQKGSSGQGEQEVWNIYDKKLLVLVNRKKELPESYQVSLRPICGGRLKASDELYDPLVDMLDAASEEGYEYWITSAWRSREKQQKLVDEDVRMAMQKGMSQEQALEETYKETMPAGHSEHETGLALDILCSGNMAMNQSQEKEPGNVWLRKNSWRYGFILRYPKEKKSVTGINYEPWHFRYVGKKAAAYMHKHDLTLEEFWETL